MRTLRSFMAGMLFVALLVGLSGTALAQEAAKSPQVTHVTGTLIAEETDDSEEEWWEDVDTTEGRPTNVVGHLRGLRSVQTIEWSDPRLPSEKVTETNFDMFRIGVPSEMPFTGSHLLVGPDGYWTGTGTGFCGTDNTCHGLDVLTGHGAYDGLYATLLATTFRGTEWDGLIFEGEMPPMPDPLEPSSE